VEKHFFKGFGHQQVNVLIWQTSRAEGAVMDILTSGERPDSARDD
jgi:hypothetical protein